jgi:hypothetical protein
MITSEANMNLHEDPAIKLGAKPKGGTKAKKPYQRPSFRHERVFETQALSCGKVQTTQGSCHSNRKNS